MSLLLLTVGTGTAGRESNIAEGLATTVRLLQPRRYWLIPSASEHSLPVADLIRETLGAEFVFEPWEPGVPYRAVERPDELENCRAAVREVIARMRTHLRKGDRLWVNPTSGTKQMSAGAVLAALDESLGEIVFTVGERRDGVVRTGTERLEVFNAEGFYAERDLELARELAASGAPGAAAEVLRRHPALTGPAEVAACLYEWERPDYEAARQVAARSEDPRLAAIRGHLTALAAAAKEKKPHALIVADLLATSALLCDRGDPEGALFKTCKALEMGLRLRLLETTGLAEPYPLAEIRELPLPADLLRRIEGNSLNARTCVLGLRQVVAVLEALGDPAAGAWKADNRLQNLVAVRNEMTHALRGVSREEAEEFLERTRAFLGGFTHLPPPPARPTLLSLP